MAIPSCFDPNSFVFTSPRAPIHIPPHLDMLSCLFSLTSTRPFHHRLAIADASTGHALTFLQLRRHIHSVARALSFLGIRQHDVVLILSPNSVLYPVLFFAIVSLGAVATTVNPVCIPSEILKQAKDSGSKLILTNPDLAYKVVDSALPIVSIDGCEPNPSPILNHNPSMKPLSAVVRQAAHHRDISIDGSEPNPTPNLNHNPSIKLLSVVIAQAAHHCIPHANINQTDTAALLYSSGTSGVSKGVILSHRNFITASLQRNFDAELHQETDLTFLCIVPMFHVYGLSIIVFGQLRRGNTIITMPRFDFMLMLNAIQTYRITNLPLVPPVVLALAKQEVVKRYDLSSVIELSSGAAPIGKETLEEVYQRLQVPDIRQGYGLTETSGIVSIGILKSAKQNYASVGPLVSGVEAVLVDCSSGKRLPPNEQGELWVRGSNIMKGYLNNPDATASTLDTDGWLHTGDLGYIDDENNLHIVDRLKELIKYKGLQVAPAELEALLVTHSEIMDAAVVPCPDDDAGEVPLAYVVRSSGSSLLEQDVIQFVAAQVAPYKKVRKVKFIEAIPKSSAGKILRRELKQNSLSKL